MQRLIIMQYYRMCFTRHHPTPLRSSSLLLQWVRDCSLLSFLLLERENVLKGMHVCVVCCFEGTQAKSFPTFLCSHSSSPEVSPSTPACPSSFGEKLLPFALHVRIVNSGPVSVIYVNLWTVLAKTI